ncbi:hypothetical protein HDU85_005051 [Gaertneriomyces sp. JEL0708]|nr:hypothetical protein HDU85_005051 [Gaertneriomyces sp. JEL0708]
MLFSKLSAAIAVMAAAATRVNAQRAPLEPSAGKVVLGAWLDTHPGKTTPQEMNQKLGHNLAMYHLAEDLPLKFDQPPPVFLIDETNTNALLYLSVYPTVTPDALTENDIFEFVKQIAGYAKAGRGVMIRLGSEMNGSWQPYGQRPLAFVQMWRRIVGAIRDNQFLTRNRAAVIWAPNMGGGYPFAGGKYSMTAAIDAAEFAALDTNKDGVLNELDDPFSPFYPGDEFVDWVGLSTYWFGSQYPYMANELPPEGEIFNLIHGLTKAGQPNFYQLYAEQKQKPFIITEAGTAFHMYRINPVADGTGAAVNQADTTPIAQIAPGPGNLAMKQAWWRQYLTNTTFLDAHPLLKAVCLFEWTKPEEETMRDFQITNDTAILNAFKQDLDASNILPRYIFASEMPKESPIVSDTNNPPSDSAPGTSSGFTLGAGAYTLIVSMLGPLASFLM